MRTIKFRGRGKKDKGSWYYGYVEEKITGEYSSSSGLHIPITDLVIDKHFVDEETIGQYTCIKDKNGVEIYEGDFVYLCDFLFDEEILCICIYDQTHAKFVLQEATLPFGDFHELYESSTRSMEVVDNIYDNPELLNNKQYGKEN